MFFSFERTINYEINKIKVKVRKTIKKLLTYKHFKMKNKRNNSMPGTVYYYRFYSMHIFTVQDISICTVDILHIKAELKQLSLFVHLKLS